MVSKASRPADITNHYSSSISGPSALTPSHSASSLFLKINNTTQELTKSSNSHSLRSPLKAREDISQTSRSLDPKLKLVATQLDYTNSNAHNLEIEISKTIHNIPSQKVQKINSLYELCLLVFKSDPDLFNDPHSLDLSLVPNPASLPQDIIGTNVGKSLSIYERGEIIRSPAVYYIPELYSATREKTDVNVNNSKNNYGFDDLRGNYIINNKDHIDYRYEIIKTLGTGSFGSVILCIDHKYGNKSKARKVALKVIKNKLDWSLQAVSEIKILKTLMKALHGPFEDNILNYCDHFHFRGHMCIVSEALSMNLYQLLKLNYHRGISLSLTKFFMKKVLDGLEFIHKMSIVHCDIKPENIMVGLPENFDPQNPSQYIDMKVKIIDFGSSCFKSETTYTYIQSRFYRAPEVIFGIDYGYPIDIWSLGCLAAELYTGSPLLPGKTETEQIALFLELLGAPSSQYVIRERKNLLKSLQTKTMKALNSTLQMEKTTYVPSPKDERKLKRTPLFSLFSIDGKINLQLLNWQLQGTSENRDNNMQAPSPFRRNVKVSSKSLDVILRLPTSNESRTDQNNFLKFLSSILRWDPKDRASASQLLTSSFLTPDSH